MLWLWLVIAAFLVLALLIAGWRRELQRQGAVLPMLAVVWPGLAVLLALLLYGLLGKHPDLPQWLADWQQHRAFAQQVVAGTPDPAAAETIPLQPLSRVLQRQLQLTPSVEGWYMLALIYRELQAPEVAVESARTAVRLDAAAVPPRMLLAQILIEQQQGLPQEAETMLRDVLREQPGHDGAQTLLASGLMGRKDYQAALPLWQTLVARHGQGDGEAAVMLRERLASAERGAEAQAHYRQIALTVVGAELSAGGTLFVFLRQPGQQGQPLAARRVLADQFPVTLTLSAEHWLQSPPPPGTALVAGARYTPVPGQAVDAADIRAQPVPLRRVGEQLEATLTLAPGRAPTD